ncbi:MAG: hypothetical protein ABIW83_02280 [Allosphingosinicella sp.]
MIESSTLELISNNFARRGVSLNSPASWSELASLDRFVGYKVDLPIKRLYLAFNGFRDMDFDLQSEIRFWPIGEILGSPSNLKEDQVMFADFSLGSHLYMCNFRSNANPVIDREMDAEVAPSLMDFTRMVSEGSFDF